MTDIHKIFQEIEKKSKDGEYIYRGEPKCHKSVSSPCPTIVAQP